MSHFMSSWKALSLLMVENGLAFTVKQEQIESDEVFTSPKWVGFETEKISSKITIIIIIIIA